MPGGRLGGGGGGGAESVYKQTVSLQENHFTCKISPDSGQPSEEQKHEALSQKQNCEQSYTVSAFKKKNSLVSKQ